MGIIQDEFEEYARKSRDEQISKMKEIAASQERMAVMLEAIIKKINSKARE